MKVKELNDMKKQLDSLSKLTEYAKLHDIPTEVIDNEIGIHIGKHWFYGV